MSAAKTCAAAWLIVAASGLYSTGSTAQRASSASVPQRHQYFAYNEIHIDEQCRILPDPAHTPPGKKPHPRQDWSVCHLESVAESQHMEERATGNQLLRNWVNIREHEFVLQNIYDRPVTFVVEHTVPDKWVVDSDPQPKQMIGRTAYFPVAVQPGEGVRLHIGLRHTASLQPKTIG
jgi:hypothetical protein